MKKLILLIIFFTNLSNALYSQAWQWAKNFGSPGFDGTTICIDSVGNSYLTGDFATPFGIFGEDTINTIGQLKDVLIVKIDNNGNFIWSKRAGGNENMMSSGEFGSDIVYDVNSNAILICGTMDAPIDSIGSCYAGGGGTIFLSKLDTSGNCIWVFYAYNGYPGVGRITVDSDGFIYMIGNFINSGNLGGFPVSPGGFLSKFDPNDGSCVWVKKLTSVENPLGPIKFFNNKLYLGGNATNDTLIIDTDTVYCNNDDIFIAEFDTSGNIQWVKTIGGLYDDRIGSISLDGLGNLYVNGHFKDTAYFETTMLINGNNKDIFIAKFDNTGNLSWVQQTHLTGNTYGGHTVSADFDGNIYVSGGFSGTANFGAFSITAQSIADLYIARYNSNGYCLGVRQAINYRYDGTGRVLSDIGGGCYIAGSFNGNTSFDAISLISYGGPDCFIAKHDIITGMSGEELHTNNQLLIYANPNTNTGKCNVTIPDEFLYEKNLALNVYDQSGKLIQHQSLQRNNGTIKLNLETEAKGVYDVILSNSKKIYSGKIIFE